MPSIDLIFVTILTWSFSEGKTIYKEVLINATTKISCFPDEDIQIQWHYTGPSRSIPHLYAGGRFHDESNRGFRLEKDSNIGTYHLVIPNTKYEDAGLYECKEDAVGSRIFGSTQLTVLESNPVCGSNMRPHGYVGLTTCNLGQEDMTFTCAVSFSGEPPQMTWKILNGWQSFNVSMCKSDNGRINCSLIIRADSKYDGSIFNCQLTRSSAECSTKVIKIQYFENQKSPVLKKNMDDKVNCSVNSNQNLQFKWTLLQDNQYVTSTENQELVIRSPGLYRCEVEYRIRNVECFALGSQVSVHNPNTTDCETDQGKAEAAGTEGTAGTAKTTVTICVLGTALVICIAIIVVLFILCLSKKKKENKTKKETK